MTDTLPWYPVMKKGTAHLPEYLRTTSESKERKLKREERVFQHLPVLMLSPEIRLVECPHGFHLSSALEQFLALLWLLL